MLNLSKYNKFKSRVFFISEFRLLKVPLEPGLSGPKDRDGNGFFKSTQFLRTNKIFWERWFYSEKKW